MAGAGAGASPAEADRVLLELARQAGQGAAPLRIGLAPAHAVELRCAPSCRIVDAASGEVWRGEHRGVLRVVADGGPDEAAPPVYRVQVGAFGSREAAERRLSELSAAVSVPGVVHHDPDRATWRVRLGEAAGRAALASLVAALRAAGVEDPWIAEETPAAAAGVKLRLVDRDWKSHVLPASRVALVPADGSFVEVERKPYRGVVELRLSRGGQVRPVNWIELESYLRGVVPEELGPEVWPQLEALKAQAVAARTYALRSLGQFADEGFDLCASPRCQVYGGQASEHKLSDRAVSETSGEILLWEERPIDALYTATCGGHTEDGRDVFADQDRPYLRGVPCRAEGEAAGALRGVVTGRPPDVVRDESGAPVTRDFRLLERVGVFEDGAAASALAPLSAAELRAITSRLARLSDLPVPSGEPWPVPDLGTAAAALVADLGWAERAALLLPAADVPGLVRDEAARVLPEREARALALLVSVDALAPLPDGRYGVEQPPSRARMARALERIGRAYGAFGLREAVVAGTTEGSVRFDRNGKEERVPLGPAPDLFSWAGGPAVPLERLDLWPGDRVRYRTGAGGTLDFLELVPPVKGTADDRSAAVFAWEVRRTREELEETLAKHASVGRLANLEVLRRGVSGRIAELRVVGDEGSTVVRGFDVRRLLDLRESLATIELQRDAGGAITGAVFAGRGWGHGVGLCQVGAYGMALRGSGYREILAHYYRGARLGSAPAPAP